MIPRSKIQRNPSQIDPKTRDFTVFKANRKLKMRRNKEVGRDKEKKTGSSGNVRSCEKIYVEEAKSIRGGRYGGEKAGKMQRAAWK